MSEITTIIDGFNPETKEYKCAKCSFGPIFSKRDYDRHLETKKHNGIKALKFEYKCEKCNYSTTYKLSFEGHLNTEKHKLSESEYKKFLSQKGKNRVKIGQETELFMLELIKTLNFEYIEYIGYTANLFDLIVKYDNNPNYYGIQIKTLTCKDINKGTYRLALEEEKYFDNTLIIAVSNNRDKFVVIFYSETNGKTINFSKTNNSSYLINDIEIFKQQIFEKSAKSTIIENVDDYSPIYCRQETESLRRFNTIYKTYDTSFVRSFIRADIVDATANNRNLQFKSGGSTASNSSMYVLVLSKLNGTIRIPYNINDKIDFFIFNIVVGKYWNDFYIIPKDVLHKLGYISDSINPGKLVIHLPPPDYEEKHWSKIYLNKFEQISLNLKINFTFNKLYQACLNKQLTCKIMDGKIIAINSQSIRHISNKQNNTNACFVIQIYENRIRRAIHEDDGYKFLIFDFGDEYNNENNNAYYIIPIDVLILNGYVSTDKKDGKTSITLPYPDTDLIHWATKYYNNFDLLF